MTDTRFAPHPWNIDFEWQRSPGNGGALTPQQIEQFDTDGFVVLENLIDSETLAQIRDTIDEIEQPIEDRPRRTDAPVTISEKGVINFAPKLVARSPMLRSFAQDRRLVDVCLDLVGPDVNLYWDQAVYKRAERPRRFPWHQDNGYNFVDPQQYLTIWLALSDATEDNGCPHVAPGVHRSGTLKHVFVEPLGYECFNEPDHSVSAPVKAGGAVVFSSLTPHLTGPNVAGGVRKAYILQYAASDAAVLEGDASAGRPTGRRPCVDPDHQFAVARGGRPVGAT